MQIGAGNVNATTVNYPQQRQSTTPLTRQQQLYSLQASYSPSVTLPPISADTTHTNNTSHYLDEQVSCWPHSRELQHHQQPPPPSNLKRETTMGKHPDSGSGSVEGRHADDTMPSTSDFVKKLYKMLEDPSFQKVVSWGPLGDCFVVKDMNDFTKSILPRMFKHSNFASFVRQLNKYDFHKVKNTDDSMFGDHTWTFRHPDFHADRREALENIKRKVPAQRKSTNVPNSTTTSLSSSTSNNHHYHHHSSSSPAIHHPHPRHTSTSSPYPPPNRRSLSPTPNAYHHHHHHLNQEITDLKSRLLNLESNFEHRLQRLESNYETRLGNLESSYESRLRGLEMGYEGRMRGLEKIYESVLVEIVGFQRGVAQQDGAVKSLIRRFLGEESKQQATSSITSAELLLPSASASTSGWMEEDRFGEYLRRQQGQDQNPPSASSQTSSTQSTRPPQPEGSSDPSTLFLPQDTAQRILDATSTAAAAMTAQELRWGGKPEFDDTTRTGLDSFEGGQSQSSQGQQQPKMSRQEAFAQMIEYHREGLDKSIGGRNRGLDGDERGRRRRSDGELGFRVEHGDNRIGNEMAATSSSALRQPTASSSSSTSPGPSVSASTSTSSGPWSSSSLTTTNNNKKDALSLFPFKEDKDDTSLSSSSSNVNGEGLQVYTVGHLMPRNTDDDGSWNFDANGWSAVSAKDVGDAVSGPVTVTVEGGDGGGRGDGNEDEEDVEIVPPRPSASTSTSTSTSSSSHQKLRVRRATFVPGWAVPPRVLLVDDDAVIRKLSSQFLKIFGCTTDVAVDGIGAVTKMNLEKYDLVLMDILMPKLDGISATNLIRKFDRGTPIISMTVNSKPNEIMEYYSSGMNDILPKPFTKEGLLDMLEKHLMHLKVMQQMTVIPRSVGVPPLSDANFEQVLKTNAMMIQQQQQRHSGTAAELFVGSHTLDAALPLLPPTSQQQQQQQQQPSQISFTSLLAMGGDDDDDDGGRRRINNPLAGMGLSDEDYNMILQNLVNGERFMGMGMDGVVVAGGGGGGMKRTIDDVGFESDERGSKRSRFEVIE